MLSGRVYVELLLDTARAEIEVDGACVLSMTAQLHITQKAEYHTQPDRQGKGMRKDQVNSPISKGCKLVI